LAIASVRIHRCLAAVSAPGASVVSVCDVNASSVEVVQ
jgi:hypothetical protein